MGKELTILMPCLNEAETLKLCIDKARKYLHDEKIDGEVLIADNGSTDGSQEIARQAGARVVHVPVKGYGAALLTGIKSAEGRYVIMGDSDDSYDFSRLHPYIEKLRQGYQLVMGNRFKGGIRKGAMPFLHKYLGNPVLSFLGRLFFKIPVSDFHCGLRGFDRDAMLSLDLKTPGMEFASEMVVKSALSKLRITEVPTVLSPDGRSRPPHLRTWRDGWRHLRFLLLYSPAWLFLYPGSLLFAVGLVFSVLLTFHEVNIGGVALDINTLLYSTMTAVLGFQLMSFYFFSKKFVVDNELIPPGNHYYKWESKISLERGLIIGFLLLAIGLTLIIKAVLSWKTQNFGVMNPEYLMRITIPSVGIILLGIQIIFYSFFMSLLDLKK